MQTIVDMYNQWQYFRAVTRAVKEAKAAGVLNGQPLNFGNTVVIRVASNSALVNGGN
jgi:hypothetical protein